MLNISKIAKDDICEMCVFEPSYNEIILTDPQEKSNLEKLAEELVASTKIWEIFGRSYQIVPNRLRGNKESTKVEWFLAPVEEGGADAQLGTKWLHFEYKIFMQNNEIHLRYKFNPTGLLKGDNLFPYVRPINSKIAKNPSSEPIHILDMYQVGWEILESLWQQSGNLGELFSENSLNQIRRGKQKVKDIQIAFYLPIGNEGVPTLLRQISMMLDHMVQQGENFGKISDLLGYKARSFKHHGGLYTGYSFTTSGNQVEITFYDKNAEQVKKKRAIPKDIREFLFNHVRVDVTFSPKGIASLARKANKKIQQDSILAQKLAKIELMESYDLITYANIVQILCSKMIEGNIFRQSFAEFLWKFVIKKIDLEAISRINYKKLVRFTGNYVGGFEDIAGAWCNAPLGKRSKWAQRIKKLLPTISIETIRRRRKDFMKDYEVDISIPYRYYLALLLLGPISMMENKALLNAARLFDAESSPSFMSRLPETKRALSLFERERLKLRKLQKQTPVRFALNAN